MIQPNTKCLIAAPSNAAIDEVTLRLSRITLSGKVQRLKVVRIGAPKSMSSSVQALSLDALVDQRLGNTNTNSNKAILALTAARADLDSTKSLLHSKETELVSVRENSALRLTLQDEVHKLKSQRQDLRVQIQRLHDQQK